MENLNEYSEQVLALAQFLGIEPEDVTENSYDYEADGAEYLVLTDSEADEKWDEYMDSYIDECVLDELPENYRQYFDSEKFKKDCSYDGRGHSLASYDGCEEVETYEGTNYYIYRIN